MRLFPFISATTSMTILRIAVALLLLAHGGIRLYAGTVNGFGEFLESRGFPFGVAIAWFLTIFEIVGGITMVVGYYVRCIAAIWMIEIIMGIILVHASNGWFVVGHQTGGVEYSVLLLFVLVAVAANDKVGNSQRGPG